MEVDYAVAQGKLTGSVGNHHTTKRRATPLQNWDNSSSPTLGTVKKSDRYIKHVSHFSIIPGPRKVLRSPNDMPNIQDGALFR